MKDERVKEIAYGIPIVGSATVLRWEVEHAIRLALAERDREVAEWARAHQWRTCGDCDDCGLVVDVPALLAFLEAQP